MEQEEDLEEGEEDGVKIGKGGKKLQHSPDHHAPIPIFLHVGGSNNGGNESQISLGRKRDRTLTMEQDIGGHINEEDKLSFGTPLPGLFENPLA
jgi:hypothetical protein